MEYEKYEFNDISENGLSDQSVRILNLDQVPTIDDSPARVNIDNKEEQSTSNNILDYGHFTEFTVNDTFPLPRNSNYNSLTTLPTKFSASLQDLACFNYTRNCLGNEKLFPCIKPEPYSKKMCNFEALSSNVRNISDEKISKKVTVSFSDSCDFFSVTDKELYRSKQDAKDMEIILPESWNVIVGPDAVQINNKNGKGVTLHFKQPIKAMVENGSQIPYHGVHSPDKEKDFSFKGISDKSSMASELNNALNLDQPLLMKYVGNYSVKEVLIFKMESVQNLRNNSDMCSKVIERLLRTSKLYKGKPVQLILNPKKVIEKLKHEEKYTPNPIHVHPSRANHNLLNNNNHTINVRTKTKITTLSGDERLFQVLRRSNQFSTNDMHNNRGPAKQASQTPIKCNPKSITRKVSSICMANKASIDKSSSDGKPKLKVRMCRWKRWRTSLKRINVKQIITSTFRDFFHFYSLVGGNLKSGSAITKLNSNYWLKAAGVVNDPHSEELASDLFSTIAGRKVVLNICDYLQFLTIFARKRRIVITELLNQLMVYNFPSSNMVENQFKDLEENLENENTRDAYRPEPTCGNSLSLPNLCVIDVGA